MECARLLVGAGANVNHEDCYGRTAISLARDAGFREIVDMLERARDDRLEPVAQMHMTLRSATK